MAFAKTNVDLSLGDFNAKVTSRVRVPDQKVAPTPQAPGPQIPPGFNLQPTNINAQLAINGALGGIPTGIQPTAMPNGFNPQQMQKIQEFCKTLQKSNKPNQPPRPPAKPGEKAAAVKSILEGVAKIVAAACGKGGGGGAKGTGASPQGKQTAQGGGNGGGSPTGGGSPGSPGGAQGGEGGGCPGGNCQLASAKGGDTGTGAGGRASDNFVSADNPDTFEPVGENFVSLDDSGGGDIGGAGDSIAFEPPAGGGDVI